MSLHSVSMMIVAPLVIAVGAVILLTPKDILRQSVLPAVADAPRASYAEKPPVDLSVRLEEASIAEAVLIVTPSPITAREGTTDTGVSATDRRWITARALNLRTGPGVASALIASLPYGTAVSVLEVSGTWAHIEADGVSGWLSANFLTKTDPHAAID
jgi:uncharacterized protein YgiM (DUF1202 family)